jgi:hypothetical protein
MKKIVLMVVGVLIMALLGIIIMNKGQRMSNAEGGEPGKGRVSQSGGSLPTSTLVEQASLPAQGQAGSAAPQELSATVKILLGLDGKAHNYPELLSAINDLDYEISAADVAALMEMLNYPNDRFPEKMRPIEINAVKNDVLDKLMRQKQLPQGLGLQLVEMAGNVENDPVWRDYCTQFLPVAWERIEAESRIANTEQGISKEHAGRASKNSVSSSAARGENKESVDELMAIRDAMFQALDERGATLAGTALIGLENLSRTHGEFDREAIVAKASEIASDEMASAETRMTALRLASQTSMELRAGSKETAVDAARSLAQTGETVLLRSAAIVTLGELGAPDDRELLESYVLADNRQIAAAAKMALAKMDAR